MSNNMTYRVPPPGDIIKEELEAREWSQADLAYVLGIPAQSVNAILNGKRSISTDMAKALGQAFDVSPAFFSNLQASYDLSVASEPDPSIAARARFQDHFPVREMIKRRWLDEDLEPALLEIQIMRFFHASRISDVPYLNHAAKKSSYEDRCIPPVQLAWLFRVRQIAKEIVAPKYSEKKLRSALSILRTLMSAPEEARRVPKLLNECGIRFVLVESLPKAKIDGVCFWLDNYSPVIGMSCRYDRIDNFWFVLRHELEHVLNGDGKMEGEEIVDDYDVLSNSATLPKEELVANEAAADFCVEQEKLMSFIARKAPFFSERDIRGFASTLGVHVGIVVGQLHARTGEFRLFRKHLVKIRHHVSVSAVTDGWGDVYPISL